MITLGISDLEKVWSHICAAAIVKYSRHFRLATCKLVTCVSVKHLPLDDHRLIYTFCLPSVFSYKEKIQRKS